MSVSDEAVFKWVSLLNRPKQPMGDDAQDDYRLDKLNDNVDPFGGLARAKGGWSTQDTPRRKYHFWRWSTASRIRALLFLSGVITIVARAEWMTFRVLAEITHFTVFGAVTLKDGLGFWKFLPRVIDDYHSYNFAEIKINYLRLYQIIFKQLNRKALNASRHSKPLKVDLTTGVNLNHRFKEYFEKIVCT